MRFALLCFLPPLLAAGSIFFTFYPSSTEWLCGWLNDLVCRLADSELVRWLTGCLSDRLTACTKECYWADTNLLSVSWLCFQLNFNDGGPVSGQVWGLCQLPVTSVIDKLAVQNVWRRAKNPSIIHSNLHSSPSIFVSSDRGFNFLVQQQCHTLFTLFPLGLSQMRWLNYSFDLKYTHGFGAGLDLHTVCFSHFCHVNRSCFLLSKDRAFDFPAC